MPISTASVLASNSKSGRTVSLVLDNYNGGISTFVYDSTATVGNSYIARIDPDGTYTALAGGTSGGASTASPTFTGTSTFDGPVVIAPSTTSQVGLTITAPSGQSADIYEITIGGTKTYWIDAAGGVHAGTVNTGSLTVTGAVTFSAPLPIAQGGNGTAAPTLVAGNQIAISGSWGNYTVGVAPSPTFSSLTLSGNLTYVAAGTATSSQGYGSQGGTTWGASTWVSGAAASHSWQTVANSSADLISTFDGATRTIWHSTGGVDWYAAGNSIASLSAGGALTLTTPLAVGSGGTGTATPALVPGANINITGSWPNQTVAVTGVPILSSDNTYSGSQFFNGNTVYSPVGTASSSVDYGSRYMKFQTSIWNGSAAVQTSWSLHADSTNTMQIMSGGVPLMSVDVNGALTASSFYGSASGLTYPAGSIGDAALALRYVQSVTASGNLSATAGINPAITLSATPSFTSISAASATINGVITTGGSSLLTLKDDGTNGIVMANGSANLYLMAKAGAKYGHLDGTSGNFVLDQSGSYVTGTSVYGATNATINGALSTNGNLVIPPAGVATSGGNFGAAGTLQVQNSVWNGSAAVTNTWQFSAGPGGNFSVQYNGANTLSFFAGSGNVQLMTSGAALVVGSSSYADGNIALNDTNAQFTIGPSATTLGFIHRASPQTTSTVVANGFGVYSTATGNDVVAFDTSGNIGTAGAFKAGSSTYGPTSATVNGNLTIGTSGGTAAQLVVGQKGATNTSIAFGNNTGTTYGTTVVGAGTAGFGSALNGIVPSVFAIGQVGVGTNMAMDGSGNTSWNGSMLVQSSIVSQSSASRLVVVADAGGQNYIESANPASNANVPLNITGYFGNQGSTLNLNFATIKVTGGILFDAGASPATNPNFTIQTESTGGTTPRFYLSQNASGGARWGFDSYNGALRLLYTAYGGTESAPISFGGTGFIYMPDAAIVMGGTNVLQSDGAATIIRPRASSSGVYIQNNAANANNAEFPDAGGLAILRGGLSAPGQITTSSTGQGSSAAILAAGGDIATHRGNNSGVVYLGNAFSHYVYFDGTNYNMPGGSLIVNGSTVIRGGDHASVNDLVSVAYSSINTQGAWLQWNRDGGGGGTWLVNQRGGGGGGIKFGESDTANNFTLTMAIDYSGNVTATGSFYANSKSTLKTAVRPISFDSLAAIKATEIYHYVYSADEARTERLGFMADQVPEHISPDGERHDLTRTIAILLDAAKQLVLQNEQLTARIAALEGTA